MASLGTHPLDILWRDEGLLQPCCVCGLQIDSGPHVRTFSLKQPQFEHAPTEKRNTIAFDGETLQLHNRHLKCMLNVRYIAISHVWDRVISRAQYLRKWSREAEDIAFKTSLRIYKTLQAHFEGHFEVWHDYISVPQWHNGVKNRTLTSIPTIFMKAQCTVVHLEDVSFDLVREMRQGKTSESRLTGLTGILEAKWFWRAWTALELSRSPNLWILTSDGELMRDGNNFILRELHQVWDKECKLLGSVRQAEAVCFDRVNGQFVCFPYHLGPVDDLHSNRGVILGAAYDGLFGKACTIECDIFTALLGLSRHNDKESELSRNYSLACLQVSRRCLMEGDYSPILLAPAAGDREFPLARWLRAYEEESRNFYTWQLGTQTSSPSLFPKIRGDHPLLTVEKVGSIQDAENFHFYNTDPMLPFLQVIRKTLAVTGLEYEEFFRTVGTQVFGQDVKEILEHLSRTGQLEGACSIISKLFNDKLSVDDRYPLAQDLADAMALNETVLKNGKGAYESPLDHAVNHGGTVHLAGRGGLISVLCDTCDQQSVFRAALFENPSTYVGSRVYRIPGLAYQHTLKDGVCIIVRDQCVVGRLVYGSYTCPCRDHWEEVQLR